MGINHFVPSNTSNQTRIKIHWLQSIFSFHLIRLQWCWKTQIQHWPLLPFYQPLHPLSSVQTWTLTGSLPPHSYYSLAHSVPVMPTTGSVAFVLVAFPGEPLVRLIQYRPPWYILLIWLLVLFLLKHKLHAIKV